MTENQIIVLVIGAILVGLCVGLYAIGSATYNEAERKRGCEVSLGEFLLLLLALMAAPIYAPVGVLVYVWMVMPEPQQSGDRATDTKSETVP